MFNLPANRQPGSILLTREDGWALRELIRPPLKTDDEVSTKTQDFCMRLYDRLVHLELEGRGEINLNLTGWDVWLLNTAIKSGAWEGADSILIQSWLVAHELFYTEHSLELPSKDVVELEWLKEEEPNAIRDEGSQKKGTRRPKARDSGGIEFPTNDSGEGVYHTEGAELSDD